MAIGIVESWSAVRYEWLLSLRTETPLASVRTSCPLPQRDGILWDCRMERRMFILMAFCELSGISVNFNNKQMMYVIYTLHYVTLLI